LNYIVIIKYNFKLIHILH